MQSKGFIAPTSKLAEDDTKIEYFPNWAESLYKPIKNKILIKDGGVEPKSIMRPNTAPEAENLGKS